MQEREGRRPSWPDITRSSHIIHRAAALAPAFPPFLLQSAKQLYAAIAFSAEVSSKELFAVGLFRHIALPCCF